MPSENVQEAQVCLQSKESIDSHQRVEVTFSCLDLVMDSVTRVAMILGACSPLGQAMCLKCVELGYGVAVTGEDEQELNKLKSQMTDSSGGHFLTIRVDFSNSDDHKIVMSKFYEQFDRLDLLINNTGKKNVQHLHEIYHEDFYQDYTTTMNASLFPAYQMSQATSKLLIQSGSGVIVNMASNSNHPLDCIANSGLVMMTKVLANAYENKGVRVIGVQLEKNSNVELTRLDDNRNTSDIAEFVVSYLGSTNSSFINGTTIYVNAQSNETRRMTQ